MIFVLTSSKTYLNFRLLILFDQLLMPDLFVLYDYESVFLVYKNKHHFAWNKMDDDDNDDCL